MVIGKLWKIRRNHEYAYNHIDIDNNDLGQSDSLIYRYTLPMIILQPIKVKICGITTLEDALMAADAGADYLGFILYPPSKRAADQETVKAISKALRARPTCPTLVGVFVNETGETITETLAACDLDMAQLSGDESVELLTSLGDRAYKGIRPRTIEEATEQAFNYLVDANNPLLVDAYHPDLYGGTGEKADWSIAQLLAFDVPHFMLAGGLNPENIVEAIGTVRPWAVDVASGVEASAGRKDAKKVQTFINHVRQCHIE